MSKYVKWEPVVGRVPPDGCEFTSKYNDRCTGWPVWADSGNRTIIPHDTDNFQFRIPATTKENPVVIKYFTFEERPEAVKEYKTLADVPEGVRCVVTNFSLAEMVRLRKGHRGLNTSGDFVDRADQYHVVQILDPLPAPQLPATMADAEECRVYMSSDGRHYFKADLWLFSFTQHTPGRDHYFYNPVCRTTDTYAMNRVRITAATNTYAVPCSQEVK